MGLEREEALAAATRLVDEVIQEAEAEVTRRRKESAQSSAGKTLNEEDSEGGLSAIIKRGTRLRTQARGFLTRILTQMRICK